MAEDVPTVLVTGASGYIATHIVQQLQQSGLYKVKMIIAVPTRKINSSCFKWTYQLKPAVLLNNRLHLQGL